MSKALGNNIKKYRKQEGLTQEDLAEKIGVTKSYISKLENGVKDIKSFKRYVQLSRALNVHFNELVPEELRFPLLIDNYEWIQLFKELSEEGFTPKDVLEHIDIAKKILTKNETS